MAFEEGVGPLGVQAVEGRLVEGRRFHDTSGGELVDDHLDEADLWGGEARVSRSSAMFLFVQPGRINRSICSSTVRASGFTSDT
jgi:hypothetical protein